MRLKRVRPFTLQTKANMTTQIESETEYPFTAEQLTALTKPQRQAIEAVAEYLTWSSKRVDSGIPAPEEAWMEVRSRNAGRTFWKHRTHDPQILSGDPRSFFRDNSWELPALRSWFARWQRPKPMAIGWRERSKSADVI